MGTQTVYTQGKEGGRKQVENTVGTNQETREVELNTDMRQETIKVRQEIQILKSGLRHMNLTQTEDQYRRDGRTEWEQAGN